MSAGWSSAYIATSTLLGEPLDATLASMGPGGTSGTTSGPTGGAADPSESLEGAALPPPAAALAKMLRSGSREVRAQALARVLSEVALALDALRLV